MDRKLGLFSGSIRPSFVLSHNISMINTTGKLALFWRFSITTSSLSSHDLAAGHWSPSVFTRHSPPAIRHTRFQVRRPGIGSALHASHATKCYVFPAFREFGKSGFRRKFLMNRGLWLFVSRRSFRRQFTQPHGNKGVASQIVT